MSKEIDENFLGAMAGAVAHIQDYAGQYHDRKERQLRLKILLLGIVSSAIEIENVLDPSSAAKLWSFMETSAKQKGVDHVVELLHSERSYSVSEIANHDVPSGMNYLGQKLYLSLYKHLLDLPEPLQTSEMLLRAVETLLTNLLHQQFQDENQHQLIDSFAEHVHLSLRDLHNRKTPGLKDLIT